MKKLFATAAAAALTLALVAFPATGALAGNGNPGNGQATCNSLGYDKPAALDASSGDTDIYKNGTLVGHLTWSGAVVTYSLQPGWSIDLCIKSGAQTGGGDKITEFTGLTGAGSTPAIEQNISHLGFIATYTPPPPTPVTPEYTTNGETCEASALVPGSISVVLKAGIVYTLTGPGNVVIDIASGSSGPLVTGATYHLTAADADPSDQYTGGSLSVDITIPPYGDDCGTVDPEPVTPAFDVDDQVCRDEVLVGGFITVDLTVPGVTYSITKNGVPVAFDPVTGKTGALVPDDDYLVEATDADPNDLYELVAPFSEPVTILAHEGDCGSVDPEPVTPAFDVDDQVCLESSLVGGFITVDLTVPGVTYSITKNGVPVAFDPVTGKTGALVPDDDYLVEATDADPNDLYELVAPFSEPVTILADESGLCDFETFPDVVPSVAYTEPTCAAPSGSFVLSNDQTLPGAVVPAVFWTVGGEARAEGVSHSVPAGSSITIVATANGPTYGFGGDEDGVLEFEHTFADAPTACGDLETLALTGQQPVSPMLGLAALLGLLGVGLVRTGRRSARSEA